MFKMLGNLTKAVIAVVLAPVDLIVDVVTLPVNAAEPDVGPFDRTAKRLKQAGKALDAAVKSD